ncbi:toxin biosynthesis protein [Histoplasma capsulatum]|uniref:Toxin biosynthesis protein n=1 Tax=Ajellomyces capsulatus TaxID=5037 RepID=A0A8A1MA45_AJECA|nr:toxin biosynthesis protein [Histoplasma capsulatum]
MSSPWTVRTHIIPAAYPRSFRRGTRNPHNSRLKLHVNEYRPHGRAHKDGGNADNPGATVIFAHGVGSVKECYEPFFADLLTNPLTPAIHAIWAADVVNHGQSYHLNEREIGDEHHWFDGAHDIMQLINHFQSSLTLPLIGIGQSWGCVHLLLPAAWHPRIFQGIVLMEPVLEVGYHHIEELKAHGVPEQGLARNMNMGFSVALMRDQWESREAAERHMRKSKYYSQLDPRVLSQSLRYELRSMPDGSVTLATPRYQQAQLFMRADPPMKGYPAGEDYATRAEESFVARGFYRGEPAKIKEYLPGVHCKALYVWTADNSPLSTDSYRNRIVGKTGIGLGGGGGEATGQVKEVFVAAEGHALPFLEPRGTARAVAKWLAEELKPQWEIEEARQRKEPGIDPITVPHEWVQRISKL